MISGRDVNFDDERHILTINGEKHAVGDPGEIEELTELIGDISETGLTGNSVAAQLTSANTLIGDISETGLTGDSVAAQLTSANTLIGDISETGLTGDSVAGQLTTAKGQINGKLEIENTAGFHNSIYRGKSLGTEVTAAQYAAIAAGTFDDMFIGDYWTIRNVIYRIAHFDYWLRSGNTECTTHHVVLVPDTNLYTAKMNESNVTTGAYVGSAMYTTNLATAKTTINTAFGATHILTHREYLANAMVAATDPTYESAGNWYDSTVELMNERMVYGADVFHNIEVNGAIPSNTTVDKSQLALFALEPSRTSNRAYWWLRCAVSASHFALAGSNGNAFYDLASNTHGVRPAFGIIAETNRETEETNREIEEETKTARTKKK